MLLKKSLDHALPMNYFGYEKEWHFMCNATIVGVDGK